jgi:hypothetical protein
MYFSDSHSAILSSSNPAKTMIPPMAAEAITKTSASDDGEEAAKKKLMALIFQAIQTAVLHPDS